MANKDRRDPTIDHYRWLREGSWWFAAAVWIIGFLLMGLFLAFIV